MNGLMQSVELSARRCNALDVSKKKNTEREQGKKLLGGGGDGSEGECGVSWAGG